MEADGYRAMKRLLALRPRVDAVFAANDPCAIGAMKAIWEAGLKVPDDIAVVGVGDITFGDLLRVPLTTVSWSRSEVRPRSRGAVVEYRSRTRMRTMKSRAASSCRRISSCASRAAARGGVAIHQGILDSQGGREDGRIYSEVPGGKDT